MIVLTEQQAAQLLWKNQFRHSVLRPLRLTDGRYALPESVLTAPEHARWRALLSQGTIVAAGSLTFDTTDPDDFYFTTPSGVMMSLYTGGALPATFGYPAPSLFDVPSPGLRRHEARYNPDVNSADHGHLRKRVELLQYSPAGYVSGDTVWASWSTIISDQRAGFDQAANTIIHQWHQHPSSALASPILDVTLNSGVLAINTRSSATGTTTQNRYTGSTPATGVLTHFVIKGVLGYSGHLTVWIDGAQVYDGAMPLGYYSESLPYLARIQSGIYMDNTRSVDVLYHANLEFGTTDLSARVDNPLPFPGTPEGWPVDPTALYPDDTLYPASNLYPVA